MTHCFSRSIIKYLGQPYAIFRLALLCAIDILLISIALISAYYLRLDEMLIEDYFPTIRTSLPLVIVTTMTIFFLGGLYRESWRYAGLKSISVLTRVVLLSSLSSTAILFFYGFKTQPPRSIAIIYTSNLLFLVGLARLAWRYFHTKKLRPATPQRVPALIYGAGDAGRLFTTCLLANDASRYFPVGYVDDDPKKQRLHLNGISVLGTGDDLPKIIARANIGTGILCMQSPDKIHIDRAIARMKNAGLNVLIMPDLADIIENKKIEPRPFDLKDLIRRPPRKNAWEVIRNRFHQQVILITGAGGSIGSELVRQIITCNPKKVILIDSCEFNLYRIEMELANYCDVEKVAILGSITDSILVDKIFSAHTPFAVFHAAAYKHVPIVEANPHIGIINNIGGTKIIADAAVNYRCEHFLLISTDKAVRPTNIMGATKRCCELMIQAYDAIYEECRFSAVRFGNVLGSSGSVVPHFQKQINEGGPVTVTHRDISRFFMLTEEAVTLILQAVTMARGGEIFVLDMGKPIKIYDLAIQMIELAGKIPGRDVEIVITQLRPGEKLNEELFIDGVEEPTQCTDILISKSPQRDWPEIVFQINEILVLTQSPQEGDPVKYLWQLVKDDHEKKDKYAREAVGNGFKKKNTEAADRWAPIG